MGLELKVPNLVNKMGGDLNYLLKTLNEFLWLKNCQK